MIVVEGVDNAGKSTLVARINARLHLPIQSSEGPPKYPGEMDERLRRYAHLPERVIFDRHPAVSQPIYSRMRGSLGFSEEWIDWLYAKKKPFFVYCEPPQRVSSLDGHAIKEHDTEEHLKQIAENYDSLLNAYRAWAARHAHIVYRIRDDIERTVSAIVAAYDPAPNYFADVAAFQEKFGYGYNRGPRELPPELVKLRLSLAVEELCEYVDETSSELRSTIDHVFQLLSGYHKTGDLARKFDALIDLTYIAVGTAYLHGFDFNEGWRRVHAANMRKTNGRNERAGGAIDAIIKSSDWTPPDLADLVTHPVIRGLKNGQ